MIRWMLFTLFAACNSNIVTSNNVNEQLHGHHCDDKDDYCDDNDKNCGSDDFCDSDDDDDDYEPCEDNDECPETEHTCDDCDSDCGSTCGTDDDTATEPFPTDTGDSGDSGTGGSDSSTGDTGYETIVTENPEIWVQNGCCIAGGYSTIIGIFATTLLLATRRSS